MAGSRYQNRESELTIKGWDKEGDTRRKQTREYDEQEEIMMLQNKVKELQEQLQVNRQADEWSGGGKGNKKGYKQPPHWAHQGAARTRNRYCNSFTLF